MFNFFLNSQSHVPHWLNILEHFAFLFKSSFFSWTAWISNVLFFDFLITSNNASKYCFNLHIPHIEIISICKEKYVVLKFLFDRNSKQVLPNTGICVFLTSRNGLRAFHDTKNTYVWYRCFYFWVFFCFVQIPKGGGGSTPKTIPWLRPWFRMSNLWASSYYYLVRTHKRDQCKSLVEQKFWGAKFSLFGCILTSLSLYYYNDIL